MKQLAFALFAVLGLTQSACRADILYVDVNYTQGELDIFKKYAKDVLHEKVVVLPAESQREQYRKNGLAVEAKKKEIKTLSTNLLIREFGCKELNWREIDCSSSSRAGSSQLKSLLEQREALWHEHDQMPSKYHASDLARDLSALKDHQFSTVVVSGHHTEGQFIGETGWIKEEDLPQIFKNLPGAQDVKSVFLLGCNAFKRETVEGVWRASFPNIEYIGGYSKVGYDRDSEAGHRFLEKVLSQHQDILALAKIEKINSQQMKALSLSTSGKYAWSTCLTRSSGALQYFNSVGE